MYYKVIKPCFLVVALPRCDTSVYIPFKNSREAVIRMKLLDLIPEKELKEAVLSEYKKRIVLYKLTDEQMRKNTA